MAYTFQYYDVVLIALGTSLTIGVGVGLLTPVSMAISVIAFAFVGFAILGHALFINGPIAGVNDLHREVVADEVPVLDRAAELVE